MAVQLLAEWDLDASPQQQLDFTVPSTTPQLIHVPSINEDDPWENYRYPLGYVPTLNAVLYSDPGTHHDSLHKWVGDKIEGDVPGITYGYAVPEHEDALPSQNPGAVNWWGFVPKAVTEMVRKQLQIGEERFGEADAGEWDFNSAVDEPQPPEVQFHDTVNDSWKWKRQGIMPGWYDQEKNIAHMGNEGDHHIDLIKAIPDPTLKAAFGNKAIGMPLAKNRYLPLLLENQGSQYELYPPRARDKQDLTHVHKALSQHLPMTPYKPPEQYPDEWNWDDIKTGTRIPQENPQQMSLDIPLPPTFRTEMENEDPDEFQEYNSDRKPWIYEPATNTFYMGMHGKLHQDVARYYKTPYTNTGALWGDEVSGYGSLTDYYDSMTPEAEQALRQRYSLPAAEEEEEEDEFGFGSFAKVFPRPLAGPGARVAQKPANSDNPGSPTRQLVEAGKTKSASEPWEQDGYMIHQVPEDMEVSSWGIRGSRPMVYHNGNLYMGHSGHFHTDVYSAFPHLELTPPGAVQHGWIDEGNEGREGSNGVGWYERPDDHEAIEQALSKAYGFDLQVPEEHDPDEFTFSHMLAAAHHDLQWKPGQRGKGWVLDDGAVWTWPIDENSKPFHMFKHFQMKQRDLKPARIPADNMYGSLSGAFEINEDGRVHRLGKPVDQAFIDAIRNAEPRLYADEELPEEFDY